MSDLIASAKAFVDLLVKEDFSTAVKSFDHTVKIALPQEKLQETWKALMAQVGPFKRQLGARTEKVQGYDGCR